MEHHLEALYIVNTLTKAGYAAYYAGGWVRDYLLQRPSDDIDIATNALPETVQNLFPRTVAIGISYGIILVLIEDKQYEVATFRSDVEYKDGRRPSKVVFTTAKEDALRRDFTINGMFFDPTQEKVLDFVEGQKDLTKKIIRSIGDPHLRIREDRLRMIRAVRISARLNFTIDGNLRLAIIAHAKELFPYVAIERVVQEFYKMKSYPGFRKSLLTLHELHLLPSIFPMLSSLSSDGLSERIAPIENFPEKIFLIGYLYYLFIEPSLEEMLSLCTYLKLPNIESAFISFLFSAKDMLLKKQSLTERHAWAHFYAHPFSKKVIDVLAAKLDIFQKHDFIQEHIDREKNLSPFITRICNKKPVVTSAHLKKMDIQPGEKMGKLLLEAEKIAINGNIEDPDVILGQLQKLPLWKEKLQ